MVGELDPRIVEASYVDGKLIVVCDFGYARIFSIPLRSGAKDHFGMRYDAKLLKELAEDLKEQIKRRDAAKKSEPEGVLSALSKIKEKYVHNNFSIEPRIPPKNRAERRRNLKIDAKRRQYKDSGFMRVKAGS